MKRAKIILCMLLALVMALSLFACKTTQTDPSPTDSGTATTSPSGTVTDEPTPSASEPATSKPSTIYTGVTGWLGRFLDGAEPAQNIAACSAVYDLLFLIDPDTKEPHSNILDSWGYTDDLTFVMTLKPGITFTNGDVATADDLLFSILNHVERQDIFVDWFGSMDFENCTSDGEYTVTLKFAEPYGPGLYGTTLYLYDKAWCEQVGWDSQDWYSNPNGTGPYKVTEYVTDDHLTMTLKDNYWNAANETFDVEEWVVKYYPDASTMYLALEKGDISLCAVSNYSDYQRWLDDGSDAVGMKVCLTGDNLLFMVGPHNNPVFDDIAVREAIAYGVDWASIGEMALGELYIQATSILVHDSPYYLDVGAYEYDPDRARQVLADAGYQDGDIVIHDYEMSAPLNKNLAEAFQYYCSEMGITVDIEFGDVTSALMAWVSDGGSDIGWSSNIFGILDREPHKSINHFYIRGFTWGLGTDQTAIDLAFAALNTIDQAERTALYHELQQYVHDNYLIFPVYASTAVVGYDMNIFTQAEIDSNVFSSNNFDLHELGKAVG